MSQLSGDQLSAYRRDGYLLARALFGPDEVAKLLQFAQSDQVLVGGAYGRRDSTGQETKLAVRNEPGDDLYGLFARSPRVVEPMQQLLGGEVYLYHLKMMLKEPRVGGAWEWHQDYGYWYNFGCLYPLLASCLIAVTPSTKENGCLQVLRGANRWDASTTARPATRPAPIQSMSRRPADSMSLFTSRPNRATPCSSTAICCIAATKTVRTIRVGR